MSFLLAVFRHAGPIRVDLNIAPGVFDILLSPDIALVNGFLPRCGRARRGVGGLHEQRGGNQRTESESGKKRPHVTFPSCITGRQSAIPQPNVVPVAPQSSTICLSWWRIWVRSAEFDRRIFLQAVQELVDDLRRRRGDPRVVPDCAVALLLQIGRRLMTFGSGRVTGGSYMFSCQIKCT